MDFPIDSYELKARYAPGFLVSAPFLITLWTTAPTQLKEISEMGSGVVSLIIWYSMAMVVRYHGKRIESDLFKTLGGNHVVEFLLWENKEFGKDLKHIIHSAIANSLHLPMSSQEGETEDVETARARARQAFKLAIGMLRKHDPKGLWAIDNAEYGFARNLYGSRNLWRAISASMCLVSLGVYCSSGGTLAAIGVTMNVLMLFLSFYMAGDMMKSMCSGISFRYAQHFWESFLSITISTVPSDRG